MIELECTDVYGIEAAIRGMRNPLNSWSKSDSLGDILCEKNIITALKKQIPKKPIKIDETYNVERQEWDYDYECPSCGNPYADDSYCSCCGQALDWSDSE